MQIVNNSSAKRILSSSQIQNILRTSANLDILLDKAFEFIGKNQGIIGYDMIAMRADVPLTLNKGEVELSVQFANMGNLKSKYQLEVTYSRTMKKFNLNEKVPSLF